MPPNPHLRVRALQRRHRWKAHPWDATWPWLGPIVLGALAAPLAQPVLLWFLGAETDTFASGLAGIGLRLGLVLCGAGILLVHEQVLRGKERQVLDPHPVEPGELVQALGLRLLLSTSGLAIAGCLLLTPLIFEGQLAAFAWTSAVVLGGWLCGISLGFLAQLGAVRAGSEPAMAGLLDLVRGSSPPMQAALIWAPGLGIALCGGALVGATTGLQRWLAGEPWGLALVALPYLLALVGWAFVPALARRSWYQATTALAEVDAAWAQVEDPEAARRVYLEWAVRWAPPGLRPHLLRTLRQGWRSHRSWILGAWGLGLLAGIAGWTPTAQSPQRALLVAGTALVVLGALAIRMETHDPAWLGRALGLSRRRLSTARALVLFAYLQGAVVPTVLAVLVQRGAVPAVGLLVGLEALAALSAALAAGVSLAGRRAWFAYPPLALALWVIFERSLS